MLYNMNISTKVKMSLAKVSIKIYTTLKVLEDINQPAPDLDLRNPVVNLRNILNSHEKFVKNGQTVKIRQKLKTYTRTDELSMFLRD